MEQPFIEKARLEIRDATEWVYNGTDIRPGEGFQDQNGDFIDPYVILKHWRPWIEDCMRLLDGDGAYQHYYSQGSLSEQPWKHMEIFDLIRQTWVSLKNAEMERNARKRRR